MFRIFFLLLGLVLLSAGAPEAAAQDEAAAPSVEPSGEPPQDQTAPPAESPAQPPTGCSSEGFHQFDFWLGVWDVYDMATDALAGRTRVEAVEAGCAIAESWLSVDGDSGRSLTSYNSVTGRWSQTWIDPILGGHMMDLEGALYSDGSMLLEGFLYNYGFGTGHPFRVRWFPDEDGSVRQYYERFDSTAQAWTYWWSGRLVPGED